MKSVTPHSVRRIAPRTFASLALAVTLFAVHPLLAQSGSGAHWVGTWTTSEVGRPQTPPPPAAPAPTAAPAPGQTPLPTPAAAPAVPAPFIQFNNQTLREIV